MTHLQSGVDSVKLAQQVQALYLSQGEGKTFGAWVLDTFYPEVMLENLGCGRDFYCAQRTTDARFYLGGVLRSGSLSPEPLQRAVELAEKGLTTALAA